MYEYHGQLRFSDTDAMGHVNHARFAAFFEDARLGLLRSLAGGADIAARGIILARLEIDYVRPLVLDDQAVIVRARVVRVGTSSFSVDYELEQRDAICARAVTVLVAYDYASGRSRRLDAVERRQLEASLETAPTA